jgi:hypothetical protein
MFFSKPIQWYQSHADPIWPDGTFKSVQTKPPNVVHDLQASFSYKPKLYYVLLFLLLYVSLKHTAIFSDIFLKPIYDIPEALG